LTIVRRKVKLLIVDNGQVYTVKAASRSTGLSAHVLRIWEKRYSAVVPHRTSTGRRVYTHEDIERLRLLREATNWGHAIGQVATLSASQLSQLIRQSRDEADVRTATAEFPPPVAAVIAEYSKDEAEPAATVATCVQAIHALDASLLERELARASVLWSRPRVMDEVIVPLMQKIGDAWRTGELRIAHEHLASAVVRTYLGDMVRGVAPSDAAPSVLVTTPAGQFHEIGALMAAAVAVSEGWRVMYMGPNLPAEEIASAAMSGRARAVALSLVHPVDDPSLRRELLKLRSLLPAEIAILVGGRAAPAYESTLKAISAQAMHSLHDLRHALEDLRREKAKAAPRPTTARRAAS
jgi:DNA-binding transcriptional MerR regulator/methylmalonyl-CoA mutase cobalamin-binding subunit